jgi:hypothetical protein
MSDLNQRFAWEALLRRIDDPQNKAAIVILVNPDNTIDTAAVGIDNEVGMFEILFSLTSQLADEVMPTFTPEQRAASPIVLPTAEQARDMGRRFGGSRDERGRSACLRARPAEWRRQLLVWLARAMG